jgi:hypothetical protein
MYVIHIYITYILHSIVYVKMTNVYSNELLFWGIAICQAGLMDRWSNGKDGTWVYPWCHPKKHLMYAEDKGPPREPQWSTR